MRPREMGEYMYVHVSTQTLVNHHWAGPSVIFRFKKCHILYHVLPDSILPLTLFSISNFLKGNVAVYNNYGY